MKKSRKAGTGWRVGLLVTAILGAALTFTACQKEADIPEDYVPVADDNPFLKDTGYAKPEVTLDGVLDEEKWQGLPEISFNEITSATVKGFYGENGIYIGAVVSDTDLWGTSSSVYDNSSFELYLDKTGEGGAVPGSNHLQLFVDINEQSLARTGNGGVWVDTDLIKSYAVKLDGTPGDDVEDKGYSIEMFIPYSQLGGESEINYGIGFGVVGCKDGERESWCGISGVNVQSPDTYYTFYRDTNSIEKQRKVNTAKSNVDGKKDDSIWNGRSSFAFGDGGRGNVSHYFAEEGLYFFFEMKDDKVSAEGSAVYLNDSVEIYLDTAKNGGATPQTDDVQVRADVSGNLEFLRGNGVEWAPASDNSFVGVQTTAKGYNIELYIPWADLGMTQAPESMEVSFGSVDWDGTKSSDGSREITWSGIGTDPQIPDNYIPMNGDKITGKSTAGTGNDGTESGSGSGTGVTVPTVTAPASEVTLDGEFNDALWSNANLFVYNGMTVKVRYVWTDNGCYMGFDVNDNNVQTAGNMPFMNSSIELYLDYQANGGSPDDKDRTILVDAGGNILTRKGIEGAYIDFNGSAIQAAAKQTGSGYTVEMYIPWAEFGGSKPAQMGVAFGQVMLWEGEEATRWFNDGYCIDPQNPELYSVFTATEIKEN